MVVPDRLKPFIPLIFFLLLGLVLFFLVKDFLGTVIVGPILYVVWFLTLIAESIPFSVIWVGFILVMLIIAIASLRRNKEESIPIKQIPIHNSGQVDRWSRMLNYAHNDKFSKWRLANELKRLTQKLLSPSDQDGKFENLSDFELPPDIEAFFEAQQPTKISFWDWLNENTIEKSDTPLDLDPEIVIQYLEKRLNS